jgi:hypothetical protein
MELSQRELSDLHVYLCQCSALPPEVFSICKKMEFLTQRSTSESHLAISGSENTHDFNAASDANTNPHASALQSCSQNQLDRMGVRRSDRIENRRNVGPYNRANSVAVGAVPGPAANPDPECNRGGVASKKKRRKKKQKKRQADDEEEWEVMSAPAHAATVGARASEAISNLSQGSMSNLSQPSSQQWILSMKRMVQGSNWTNENGAFITNSLLSLVNRCRRSVEIAVGVDFMTMINMIQLAAKSDRYIIFIY